MNDEEILAQEVSELLGAVLEKKAARKQKSYKVGSLPCSGEVDSTIAVVISYLLARPEGLYQPFLRNQRVPEPASRKLTRSSRPRSPSSKTFRRIRSHQVRRTNQLCNWMCTHSGRGAAEV